MFTAIEIEINHDCNRKCSYCPNSKHERIENGNIDLDLYQTLMKQLHQVNFKGRVSYDFYNEPLLNKDFIEITKMTKRYLPDCHIVLYSNGTLLTSQKFGELVASGVEKFVITKHEGFDDYEFDRTYLALDQLSKSKVLFRHHSDICLTNRGGMVENIGEEIPNLIPCFVPSHVVTVTVLGNVLPCYEDFYQKNVMGNIGQEHIMDIWNSERYDNFRKMLRRCLRHKFSPCKNCNRISDDSVDTYMK